MPTLDWIGKNAVRGHHLAVPYHLLECDRDFSVGDPGSGNLLVQGDNLLALKALLPYYAGKVKCIYIDPPYNTGNERWVYNDNVNSPEIRQWLEQLVGKEGEDLSRHDKWLCMMYPRLALLRQFLTEDGAIFVSIDDNEVHNLIACLDELFGPDRRLAIFTWVRKKKGSNLSKEFRKITEYVVAYKRSARKIELFGVPAYAEKRVPLLNRANPESSLLFPACTVRVGARVKDGPIQPGRFGKGELSVVLAEPINVRDGVVEPAFSLTGRWRWSQSTVNHELANGSIFTLSKDFRINVDRYDQASKFKAPSSLLSPEDGVGTNEDATEELRALFPEEVKLPFDFPKPISLVQYLVRALCKDDQEAIVLDSFAGTGTTGHAVLAQNRADGGTRRFIVVEMHEGICRKVTYQRLRKAVEGYGDTLGLGGGFRYCTLGRPLFDEQGNIGKEVTFDDLAAHVFFSETGEPMPMQATSPLLGVHDGRAIYLLFNGILGDRHPGGGNVLTRSVVQALPEHEGPKVVYAEACRLSPTSLREYGITLKQVPS
jgi:site-specific DNA-methyltransferase (adenine-specific)/adenine-specific DNA-methyltransferase